MIGKILALVIVAAAVVAGAALYYLQIYAYYEEVAPGRAVEITRLSEGAPDEIVTDNFRGIDSNSSPLRYRACFTTSHSLAMLTETYEPYPDAVPLTAPGWFECFDATEIGEALEDSRAVAFLGEANFTYGFDRVVAIMDDGRGFVWHQLNHCGEKVFDGQPAPEGCPEPPERLK